MQKAEPGWNNFELMVSICIQPPASCNPEAGPWKLMEGGNFHLADTNSLGN